MNPQVQIPKIDKNCPTLSAVMHNEDKDKVYEIELVKNISEVTEPLKEQIQKSNVHTIDEMKAWLKPLGYSDAINEAAVNFILRAFVMSKISADSMMNMDMVVDLLRPQLKLTTKDIEPFR